MVLRWSSRASCIRSAGTGGATAHQCRVRQRAASRACPASGCWAPASRMLNNAAPAAAAAALPPTLLPAACGLAMPRSRLRGDDLLVGRGW